MSYIATQHVLTLAVEALSFTPIVVLMVDFVLFLGRPRVEPIVSLESEPGLPSMAELLSVELPSLVQPDNVSYGYTEASVTVADVIDLPVVTLDDSEPIIDLDFSKLPKAALLDACRVRGIHVSSRATKATLIKALS